MEKRERGFISLEEIEGRGGRRGEGGNGEMGADPTKFGKKSMPMFTGQAIGLLPAA